MQNNTHQSKTSTKKAEQLASFKKAEQPATFKKAEQPATFKNDSRATLREINLLPPEIFNLLSAGEVVENPASVVKELIENSLDAGATSVQIEIRGGGADMICVTDNGTGCARSQVDKVFLPHATSKITTAQDINEILTFGFRGEALASIASVSKIDFITRTADDTLATCVEVVAGDIVKKSLISANIGSSMKVKNLFFNTPARRKFLKSARVEQNNISHIISRFILAHPATSFRFKSDGETIYDYIPRECGNLAFAIEFLYGSDTVLKLLNVSAQENDMQLDGYISIPSFTKRNRTYQHVFVRGRQIMGGIVAQSVNRAFESYMTSGNFPFFVLNLTINLAEIDVNVHPQKATVRFLSDDTISQFVREAVTACLDKYLHKSAKGIFDNASALDITPSPLKQAETINLEQVTDAREDQVTDAREEQVADANEAEILEDAHDNFRKQAIKFFSSNKPVQGVASAHNILNIWDQRHATKFCQTQYVPSPRQRKKAEQTEIAIDDAPIILGTLFDTFILFKQRGEFYILDAHAAHERLLYDKLTRQVDKKSFATQELVEPCLLMLSPHEMNKMVIAEPYLRELGIECEQFSNNSYRITAIPACMSPHQFDTVITNLLADLPATTNHSISGLLKSKLITLSCKSAIKSGTSLSSEQIRAFLDQFKSTSIVPTCPHGRPIFVVFSRSRLERMFSR